MNRGFSAESPNALRSFPMAILTAWSKSPKLSLGQTRLRNSSRVTTSPGRSSNMLQQFHRLLLDPDSQARFAHFARLEGDLVGAESHDGGGPEWFHSAFGLAEKSSTSRMGLSAAGYTRS